MAEYETKVNRVLVADMTGKSFDVKTCCARCNLPLGKGKTQSIGKYSYGQECIYIALDTMKQEDDAERTRVTVCYEKIRYSALTTVIGQYGRRDAVDGKWNPFCDAMSVIKTLAKWDVPIHEAIAYVDKRWANPWEKQHHDMMIEHIEDMFKA